MDQKYKRSTDFREVRPHDFNHWQSPSGKMLQQAVHIVFYFYTLAVLVEPGAHNEKERTTAMFNTARELSFRQKST